MKLTFDVYHSGERAAGINSFSDTLTVEIESGDPGGEPGEFAEHMRQFLSDWYDTKGVALRVGDRNMFDYDEPDFPDDYDQPPWQEDPV